MPALRPGRAGVLLVGQAGKVAGKAWQGPGAGQWQEQPLAPGQAPGAQVLSSDYQVPFLAREALYLLILTLVLLPFSGSTRLPTRSPTSSALCLPVRARARARALPP